jgi:hypothetical protein
MTKSKVRRVPLLPITDRRFRYIPADTHWNAQEFGARQKARMARAQMKVAA